MKPTEFDIAKAEFYKGCANLIVSFGEWENIYFCSKCDGELDPKAYYMFPVNKGYSGYYSGKSVWSKQISYRSVSCPHCFTHKVTGIYEHCVWDSNVFPTYFLRRRKVYTSRKPSWWQSLWGAEQEYFYEYSKEVTI